MPATDLPEAQAARIVAYLRSVSASQRESSARATARAAGRCSTARASARPATRAEGRGGRLGPDCRASEPVRRAVETGTVDPRAGPRCCRTTASYRVVTRDGRDDRPAAQPRHIHRAAAGRVRAAALVRQGRPPGARLRRDADAVGQGHARPPRRSTDLVSLSGVAEGQGDIDESVRSPRSRRLLWPRSSRSRRRSASTAS